MKYKFVCKDINGDSLKVDLNGTNAKIDCKKFDINIDSNKIKRLIDSIGGIQTIMSDFKFKSIEIEVEE